MFTFLAGRKEERERRDGGREGGKRGEAEKEKEREDGMLKKREMEGDKQGQAIKKDNLNSIKSQ